jgi:hypothetical protein
MSWNQGNYIIKSEEVKVKGKVRRKSCNTWSLAARIWFGKFACRVLNAGIKGSPRTNWLMDSLILNRNLADCNRNIAVLYLEMYSWT